MARIGFFGGSFNPIHVGHLILTELVRCEAGLDRVLFVPAKDPPHKPSRHLAAAGDRLRMVRLAVADNESFEASTIELDREGPSYTLITVRQLKEQLGPQDTLHLIVGADSVHEMPEWWQAGELVREVPIIALRRPGYPLENLDRLEEEFGPRVVRRITDSVVDAPLLQISSTDIRNRLRGGRSIRYLVPEAVRRYLLERRLYAPDG